MRSSLQKETVCANFGLSERRKYFFCKQKRASCLRRNNTSVALKAAEVMGSLCGAESRPPPAPLRLPEPRRRLRGERGSAARPAPPARDVRASHRRPRPAGTGYTAVVPAGVFLCVWKGGGGVLSTPLKRGFRPGTCGPSPRFGPPRPRATHA